MLTMIGVFAGFSVGFLVASLLAMAREDNPHGETVPAASVEKFCELLNAAEVVDVGDSDVLVLAKKVEAVSER